MNMFMIYISAMYETRMLLTCFMVVGRFKNLRRKLGVVPPNVSAAVAAAGPALLPHAAPAAPAAAAHPRAATDRQQGAG